MGVPVGSLGGQKDSRGLGAEPRSARCPLRPGQSVYSVPPACFSGTPQCSGRSLDAPRLQRGKLRLGWGHSSASMDVNHVAVQRNRRPHAPHGPPCLPVQCPVWDEGHQTDGNPQAGPACPPPWPTRPGLPAPTPDQRRQDFALSRTAGQGQHCGRAKPPAGWGTSSCHPSPGCPAWRPPGPGPGHGRPFHTVHPSAAVHPLCAQGAPFLPSAHWKGLTSHLDTNGSVF